jgi:DNA invertase Pin-like site-specific DNA recombinase
MRKRVIGYVRVSTQEQADEGVSLAAQERRIRAYCEAGELELLEVLVDAGKSASSLDRPGIQRALELLASGQASGIVVLKLDRLTRSIRDLSGLLEAYFGPSSASLHSVTESLDPSPAVGRLMLNLIAAVSQWERETTVERTVAALEHKRSEGRVYSGTIRYGMERSAEDPDKLVPSARDAAALARILELHALGLSSRAICSKLDAEGVPTKTGKSGWKAQTVLNLLQRAGRDTRGTPRPRVPGHFVSDADGPQGAL